MQVKLDNNCKTKITLANDKTVGGGENRENTPIFFERGGVRLEINDAGLFRAKNSLFKIFEGVKIM
ncbi:hypothetical protein [Streptococcus suis]|uniref:hypothetical protein n=1 Tax=Streptococcus suis TaxID=1307 RepID=UPI0038B82D7D